MKLCGATAAALGIACRLKILRSGNAGVDDGANAFEQEHQSNRYTDCRRADPRIHHADKTRAHQQNADGKDPAPAAHAEGVQIECADEPGNAGEHQPDRKDKRQRQKCEPLVKEQEQRHDHGQNAVEQQPAGADQHTARSGENHDLRDACSQHENAEHQTRGQNRNIFIAQTINACRNQQDASYDIQDPNCFCVHAFFLFSFEVLFELLFVFMPLVYSFSAKKQETGSTRNVDLIVRKAQTISRKKTA